MLSKKSILHNTIKVGTSTLASRFLGIIREWLMVRYLGAGALSDAFLIAYKIPTSLRKIFAEGALSAAFVPSFISALRTSRESANSLMSLAFLFFEGGLLILCALVMIFAPNVLWLIAPGFSAEQISMAIPFLRILMPFIFFISSTALLAGALQAVGNFFVPSFGPILLNIVMIMGLFVCWKLQLPVTYLCVIVLLGGLLQFLHHLYAYFKCHFSFGRIDRTSAKTFGAILIKFCLCLLSMSMMEISLFIDTTFASYLPGGTISLLYYASRFVGIPLGVFGVAFSTILLPHFSRISVYAPKRLNFYLLEAAKLIFWITIPCMLLMSMFAGQFFTTLFVSKSFSVEQGQEAGYILIAFASGLFFFSFNKILLNVFYALHDTVWPSIICSIAAVCNIGLNFIVIKLWGSIGLALATTISALIQMLLLMFMLNKRYKYHAYIGYFVSFLVRYSIQLCIASLLFLSMYYGVWYAITLLPGYIEQFLLYKIGFWMWIAPLALLSGAFLYTTRKLFGIRLYFLD